MIVGLIFLGVVNVFADPRCPLHWIHIGSSCYRTRYNYAVKNWDDGRYWCQTQDADLAKFDDLAEKNAVRNYQGLLADNVPFWIGLHRVEDEWRWADNSSVNESILDMIRVDISGYDCIQFSKNYEIMIDKCGVRKGILCELPAGKQIRCDSSNEWQAYGEKCYRVMGRKDNWQRAKDECSKRNSSISSPHTEKCYRVMGRKDNWQRAKDECSKRNSSISSPHTEKEQFALFDFVQNNGQALWIGLSTSKQMGNTWYWSDGSALTTNFWGTDPTTFAPGMDTCAYIDPKLAVNWSASWSAASCGVTNGNIICERPAENINNNLVYHSEEVTWYEAERICALTGGTLATRDEVFSFDDSAWIRKNITGTETTSNLCPYVAGKGSDKGDCNNNRTFVCSNNSVVNRLEDPPTDPAVVAVSVVLVLIFILVIVFLIIWFRQKKRRSDKAEGQGSVNDLEKSNGATNNGVTKIKSTAEKQSVSPSSNGHGSDTGNTYDHTTSQVVSHNPQNIYDHCTKSPENTYDHTSNSNDVTKKSEEYGTVDLDDETAYKSIDRNVVKSDQVNPNYDHV